MKIKLHRDDVVLLQVAAPDHSAAVQVVVDAIRGGAKGWFRDNPLKVITLTTTALSITFGPRQLEAVVSRLVDRIS